MGNKKIGVAAPSPPIVDDSNDSDNKHYVVAVVAVAVLSRMLLLSLQ